MRDGGATLAAAETIAQRWNQAGIGYAVVHGLENYPQALGRDLDVLVRREDRKAALRLAISLFKEKGWEVAIHRKPWADWIFGFLRTEDGWAWLEIDLFDRVLWGPCLLASAADDTYAAGPFRVASWGAFAKRVLIQVLGNGTDRFRRRPQELQVKPGEARLVREKLATCFGKRLGDRFLKALEVGDVEAVAGLAPELRRRLMVRTWLKQKPGVTLQTVGAWVWNSLAEHVGKRCAPIVAVAGGDSRKRHEMIRRLETASWPFPVKVLRWPGGQGPVSVLRRLCQTTAFPFWFWRTAARWSARLWLVVLDGYPAERCADEAPGKDRERKLPWWVPRPDVVLCVDGGSAGGLHGRLEDRVVAAFLRRNPGDNTAGAADSLHPGRGQGAQIPGRAGL